MPVGVWCSSTGCGGWTVAAAAWDTIGSPGSERRLERPAVDAVEQDRGTGERDEVPLREGVGEQDAPDHAEDADGAHRRPVRGPRAVGPRPAHAYRLRQRPAAGPGEGQIGRAHVRT